MVSKPLKEGLWNIHHIFSRFVTRSTQFLAHSPALLTHQKARSFSLSVILVLWIVGTPFSDVRSAQAANTTPAQVQLVLSLNKPVFEDAVAPVRFVPGDSNTTKAFKEQILHIEQTWQHFSEQNHLYLRTVSYEQMTDAIDQYFLSMGSPLFGQANQFVETSTKYSVDPRLLVGIAGHESSAGLHMPEGSFNPFGLGPSIYFANFNDAIEAEAQFLHDHFWQYGVSGPAQIGPSYTGTGSTSWGESVLSIMQQI